MSLLVHTCTGLRLFSSTHVAVYVYAGPRLYRSTFLMVHICTRPRSVGPYLYRSTFLLVHICTRPRSAGPYMYQTTICWSISVPVHVSAGPYLYRYTFLLIHICTSPRFCWSISVPVHVSAGPYLNRSTICWSIFVPDHVSAGPYLYRSTFLLVYICTGPKSAGPYLYRTTFLLGHVCTGQRLSWSLSQTWSVRFKTVPKILGCGRKETKSNWIMITLKLFVCHHCLQWTRPVSTQRQSHSANIETQFVGINRPQPSKAVFQWNNTSSKRWVFIIHNEIRRNVPLANISLKTQQL